MRVLFVTLLAFMFCSSQRAEELVTVPLVAGDREYSIQLVPTFEGVQSMAAHFCVERGVEIGVTGDSLACRASVADYLTRSIISQRVESQHRSIRVPLKIGSKEFSITLPANQQSAIQMARQFCSEQGASLGFTDANVNSDCVGPLSVYLADAARKEVAPNNSAEEALLKVSMRVEGDAYDFAYNPSVRSHRDMALEFCQQHGGAYGVTLDTLPGCVSQVATYLQQAAATAAAASSEKTEIKAAPAPAPVTARIQIDDNTFEFKFAPDSASARATAEQFCAKYGPQLGLLPENNEGCVNVVLTELMRVVI
jgi:hypothetical protein